MLRKLGQSEFSGKTCSQHPAQTAKHTRLRWGFEPGFLLLITAPLQCVMLAARGLGQMEGVRSRVSRYLPETSDSVSTGGTLLVAQGSVEGRVDCSVDFFVVFIMLGIESRASNMGGECSTMELHL